jgi:SAM-dependent methyltransferase
MHPAAWRFVTNHLPPNVWYNTDDGLPHAVVDLGGRNINGSPRALIAPPCHYVSVDLVPGPGVDVVADAAAWWPPDGARFDLALCCEVLEHTPRAAAILAHAYDLLRPGGTLIVTAAGEGRAPHSAAIGGSLAPYEFYRNVTRGDLSAWLASYDAVQMVENQAAGDIYAVARKAV